MHAETEIAYFHDSYSANHKVGKRLDSLQVAFPHAMRMLALTGSAARFLLELWIIISGAYFVAPVAERVSNYSYRLSQRKSQE
jgi:hypothetical protein